jgi:hypothetical protein
MRRTLCIWVMAAAAMAASAEVIDRIVVVVNRTPILASDCDEELRFEALADGRALDATPKAMEAAVDRLIDQMLIEQQMTASKYVAAGDAETDAAVERVRKQISPDGQQWAIALQRYGLPESAVAEHLRRQVNQLRYIELRFQSEARPAPEAVQRYYREQYLPRLRAAGGGEKALAEVREPIEQILTEQRIDQLLATWLQTLRSQAQIERRAPATGARTGNASGSE